MFGTVLGWFRRGKKDTAKARKPPSRPPRRRRPSLAPSGPMYSQIEAYALDLLAESGQRFATKAEREDAMRQLAMEIEDSVHDQVFALLTPDDRAQAEALESEAERHAFLRSRLGDVEARITWAMSEFRKGWLADHSTAPR